MPNLPPHAAGIYLKHSLRRMDVAIASVAAVVRFNGDVCEDAKIALGAVGPTPFRALKAEAALKQQKLMRDASEREVVREVARIASDESLPIDDFRSYADDRRTVVGTLVAQALEQAIARARI